MMRIQGLVFQKDGEKLNHTYREVQRLCEEQSIADFVFHDLRHCAATNLAEGRCRYGNDHEDRWAFLCRNVPALSDGQGRKLDAAMTRLEAVINTPVTPRSVRISNSLNN